MIRTDRRRFPILFAAIAALAVAGAVLASLFSTADVEAETETTNFYLWRTTMTVGVVESPSVELIQYGYESSRFGSISTDADFGYPPWKPPHKHHVDRDGYITVGGISVSEFTNDNAKDLFLRMPELPDTGDVTLWLGHKSYTLSSASYYDGSQQYQWGNIHANDSTDLDWKGDDPDTTDVNEADQVKVALVYERRLPSAPTNVSVTAPEGEEGTLEVSWDEADDGTFPIECYLVEFRHPSGEARDRKQSYPGSLGTGKGCGDSPPTRVKRTDLEPGVEYQVLVQALSGDGYGDWSETKLRETSSEEREQRREPDSAPAKPTGLSATATHDQVVLTWDDPDDDTITGYVILRRNRKTDEKGKFRELVPDTGTAATTYTDDTVSAETLYTYRIKAINGAGTSERSRWFHIDTPAAP